MTSTSQSFTLDAWVELPGTSAEQNTICGYDSVGSEILSTTSDDHLVAYNVETKTWTTVLSPFLGITPGITCLGQCYTQIDNYLYFVWDFKFGRLDTTTKALTFPFGAMELQQYGQRACLTASLDGQYLFVIGGSKTAENSMYNNKIESAFVYNIGNNSLDQLADMATIRSSLSCNVVGDYLYAIGGDAHDDGHLDTIERLHVGNPLTMRGELWSVLTATLRVDRNQLRSVVINQQIYIVGGLSEKQVVRYEVERYDPATDRIYNESDLPMELMNACSVVVNEAAFVDVYTMYNGRLFRARLGDYGLNVDEYVDSTHMLTTSIGSSLTSDASGVEDGPDIPLIIILECVALVVLCIASALCCNLLRRTQAKRKKDNLAFECSMDKEKPRDHGGDREVDLHHSPSHQVGENDEEDEEEGATYGKANEIIQTTVAPVCEEQVTLKAWLCHVVGLPQYYDTFVSNGYETLELIKEVEEAFQLQEIGIAIVKHQRLILVAVKELNVQGAAAEDEQHE